MGLGHRSFGPSGIKVSPLTLGTMRFSDKGLSVASIRTLMAYAYERGVTTHHVSGEYRSFESYREALLTFPKAFRDGLVIIAKLPFPHFKDGGTDVSIFERRVDEYLDRLGLEKLDVVQWLFQSEPLDDSIRIPRLRACAEDLKGRFDALVDAGKVGTIASFPYTGEFWRQSARLGLANAQVNYLNLLETEYAGFLDECHFIAIRPLAAGRLSARGGSAAADVAGLLNDASDGGGAPESLMSLALNFPLWHPNVASVILGVNSREDLDEALAALRPETDIGRFNKVVRLLQGRAPATVGTVPAAGMPGASRADGPS